MSAREDASIGTGIGPRVVLVREPDDNSDSSTYEGSSEEEEEERWQNAPKGSDLPSEYWHIQKLVKYMKVMWPILDFPRQKIRCCIQTHRLKII